MRNGSLTNPSETSRETGISQRNVAHRAILRCREKDIGTLSSMLGIALPRDACRSVSAGALSGLWLGPDEWLLLTVEASDDWGALLATQADGPLYSLVDISHRQVAFDISGAHSEDILASGCALDLDISRFPVGMCTRTMFHKAEIVLWRTGLERFHLEVWRSFARYAEALLRAAENEA